MRNMPRFQKNGMHIIIDRMRKKAHASRCESKISAFAFDKNGEYLGCANNLSRMGKYDPRFGKGRGIHAEMKLIHTYGERIKTIMICRVGLSGEWRPIKCCPRCQAIADKLGINVITITECQNHSENT